MNTRPDDLEPRLRDALADRAARTTVHEREWDEHAEVGGVVDLDAHRPRRVVMSAVALAALVALVVGVVAVVNRRDTTTHAVQAGAFVVKSDGVTAYEPGYLPTGFHRAHGPDGPTPDDTCIDWSYRDGELKCGKVAGARYFVYENGKGDQWVAVTLPGNDLQRMLGAVARTRTVTVRGHRASLSSGGDGTRVVWQETDAAVFVSAPKGASDDQVLRVANGVRAVRTAVRAPVSLAIADLDLPASLASTYGKTFTIASRPEGRCVSYAVSMPCIPLQGAGPLQTLGRDSLDGPLVIARVAPGVDRVEVRFFGGATRRLKAQTLGAPFDGQRWIAAALDANQLPRQLVAYDRNGRVVARKMWRSAARRGYRELARGVADGIAWRLSYHAGSNFCVQIDSVFGSYTGTCEGGGTGAVSESSSVDDHFVLGTTTKPVSRIEVDGEAGRVFTQPGWTFRLYLAVRGTQRARQLTGYDANGRVVLSKEFGSCRSGSCSSGSGGVSGSGESSDSRSTSATTGAPSR